MIGAADKIPPTLAALSEAKQLLEMLGDDRTLRKQLEKLKAQTAEFRTARADAEKAIAAVKAESKRALDEIAEAKAAVELERKALETRADALRGRERELKAREEALKPKWEELRREAIALQGRASEMAASAIAFARDLEADT